LIKKISLRKKTCLLKRGEVKKSAAKEAAIKDSLARLQTAAPAHLDSTQALTRKPDFRGPGGLAEKCFTC